MPVTPSSAPNLLLVFADQMRPFSMAHRARYGDLVDPVRTPRLDRLAGEGLSLTHATATYPLCSPFRAMLMTGQSPRTNGVLGNINSLPARREWAMRTDAICLTDALAGAGYDVGYVGKWHLDAAHEPFLPFAHVGPRGDVWDEWVPPERRHGITFWHAYNAYDGHLSPRYWVGNAPRLAPTTFDRWSPEHEAEVVGEFLRDRDGSCRQADTPFAMIWSINPPHPPYHAVPKRYLERFGDATPGELLVRPNVDLTRCPHAVEAARGHFAMVEGVDEQVGRVLDTLTATGRHRDTLVVFCSDHGEMLGSHGRMQKSVWYDESLRIPMILRLPGRLKAGSADDTLIAATDLMPTVLGLLGLGDRVPPTAEGVNYAPLLQGDESAVPRPASAYYFNHEMNARGVRTHRYTFAVTSPREQNPPGSDPIPPGVYLYDNAEDPFQRTNLAAERPGIVRDLRESLNARLAETADPWPAAYAPASVTPA